MKKHHFPTAVVIALLFLALPMAPRPALAFIDPASALGAVNTKLYHSYDGLICYDCHLMHNSEDGAAVADGGPYPRLLNQPTVTDICLSCHTYPASTAFKAPPVMTPNGLPPATSVAMPSGDFYWSSFDSKRGHNPGKSRGVQAAAMPSDTTLTVSPGGNYATTDWDCASCHDPHNRFGADVTAWRQLRRKVNGVVHTGNETVSFGVETYGGDQGATAPGYEPLLSNSRGDIRGGANETAYVNTRKDGNPLEGAVLRGKRELDTNKNVYRGGFSSFCSVCHGDFHGGNGETRTADNANTRAGSIWIKHPVNVTMDQSTGSKYGISTYKAAITNAQGNNPNPPGYDFRYPLVKANADFSVKSAVASASDPTTLASSDRIMCLTCHKAHASQFENMTRWDTNAHAFIKAGNADVDGQTYDSTTGAMVAGVSLGDNPAFGCGKCHQKGGTNAYVKAF